MPQPNLLYDEVTERHYFTVFQTFKPLAQALALDTRLQLFTDIYK